MSAALPFGLLYNTLPTTKNKTKKHKIKIKKTQLLSLTVCFHISRNSLEARLQQNDASNVPDEEDIHSTWSENLPKAI